MTGQRFDGFEVNLYEGGFSGTFDMDEGFASDLRFDDVVTFIVTARIHDVGLKETKLGDLKRLNKFQVTASTVLDSQTASKVLAGITPANGQMVLGQEVPNDDDDDPLSEILDSSPSPVNDPVLAAFLSSSDD